METDNTMIEMNEKLYGTIQKSMSLVAGLIAEGRKELAIDELKFLGTLVSVQRDRLNRVQKDYQDLSNAIADMVDIVG